MTTTHYYELPLPPSLNRAYRAVAGRVILSEVGRKYVSKVVNALPKGKIEPLRGRLLVIVKIIPTTKLSLKRFDVMNREKLLCDALTKARVWLDDSQIDSFNILRGLPDAALPDGAVNVEITDIDN